MTTDRYVMTPERQAAQISGLFRLEGFQVTKEAEAMCAAVIRGDVKAEDLIREILAKYAASTRNANQGTADN